MKLRDVEWGNVFNSSGARGFYGEGYWFHKVWAPFGLSYKGSTFVTKTTTLMPRMGNMPIDGRGRPRGFVPSCIVVKPMKSVVLNAVGLSGPGALYLIEEWKTKQPPFFASFMSVAAKPEERLAEAKGFCELMKKLVESQGTDYIGIQVNFSCPNVGLDTSHLVDEVSQVLDETKKLGIATLIKLNALVSPLLAAKMAQHEGCDGIVISNTIPWGQFPNRIDWVDLFGTDVSPLAKFGGGGLSGAPLLPIVCAWLRGARDSGITKPIVGGGGILSKEDADMVLKAGANGIELGSVSILRPWRVRGIIKHVNARLGTP